jgi:CRISPR-associated protein Cas5d
MISVNEVLGYFQAKKPAGNAPSIITTENREQRFNVILRDVEYILEAHIEKTFSDPQFARHAQVFERRIKKGQCFKNPHLGTSEYPADVVLLEKAPRSPLNGVRDLGFMLYDIDYLRNRRPLIFRAKMVNGIINVPQPNSKEVLG